MSIIISKIKIIVFWLHPLSHPLVLEIKMSISTICVHYCLENVSACELLSNPFRSSTGAWESKYQYWISVWIIILKIEILVSFDSTPFNYSTGSLESKYQYQLSVCIIILKIKILGSFECTHLSYPLVFENQNVNSNYLFVLPSWKLEY